MQYGIAPDWQHQHHIEAAGGGVNDYDIIIFPAEPDVRFVRFEILSVNPFNLGGYCRHYLLGWR